MLARKKHAAAKMDLACLKLLVALLFVQRVSSLPLGCQDNGTSYKEGEVVRAGEPCLSCVCRRGALACSLRVCADYVDALPPGCLLVHKANDCCPRLLCEGDFGPNGVEVRTAVKTSENKVEANGCVVNGTLYGEGSAVGSWDPCEYCYCTEGGVRCVRPRCMESLEGCEAVYEKFSCCPTHFDCRDARIGLFTSRVKHLGDVNSLMVKNSLRSLSGTDTDPEKENTEAGDESTPSSTSSEEKMTEDIAGITTEEVSTEEPETTTPSSLDHPTTLSLQATESSTGVFTEETTPPVTTEASKSEEGGEEASGAGSGGPTDVGQLLGNHWNSSEVAEDYDAYDYGEPELPPSLPNLVIFPFVAADAVVKDDRTEVQEGIQEERSEEQALIFKDYFSPPTRTEGGFVPKQPSPEPFYEFPFPRKEQPTESAIKVQQTAPPQQSVKEAAYQVEDYQKTGGDSRRPPSGQELQTERDEFLTKSQQTKKPVTVAYKNVVVDFYPDRLVTTTRGDSNATDASLHQTNATTPVSLNAFSDMILGFSGEATTILAPAEAVQEVMQVAKMTPTSVPKESSFLEQFLKSLIESNTPTAVTFTASGKHKYSSKIKGRISTTTKPKREDGPTPSHSFPSGVAISEGPVHSTEGQGSLGDVRGHHAEKGAEDGPSSRIQSNPGTLLKLAGCNIYGMMYRIGKVITELSGPCMECLCTDLGVECHPLSC